MTGISGWYLAKQMGFLNLPYPYYWWLVAKSDQDSGHDFARDGHQSLLATGLRLGVGQVNQRWAF